MSYRHELKYYITQAEYVRLSKRLKLVMEQDENAKRNGGEYFIRSLYFDDYDDFAFRSKLDGVDARDKFRVRIYNMESGLIKLECKHKDGSYVEKKSLLLSLQDYQQLRQGDYSFFLQRNTPFARKMFAAFTLKRLRPVVMVDYSREAYVFPLEDVRVTFDKHVSTAHRNTDLFNAHVPTYNVIEPNKMVMEVKFNNTLPMYIRSLLQAESHDRSAISKYCLCRKFEL